MAYICVAFHAVPAGTPDLKLAVMSLESDSQVVKQGSTGAGFATLAREGTLALMKFTRSCRAPQVSAMLSVVYVGFVLGVYESGIA
jgi:hypothetical protein